MNGKYLTLEDAEKLANYDKLKTELEETKKKMEYWKNEHFILGLKYEKDIKEQKKENKRLIEENASLKKIITEVNRGNNGATDQTLFDI